LDNSVTWTSESECMFSSIYKRDAILLPLKPQPSRPSSSLQRFATFQLHTPKFQLPFLKHGIQPQLLTI
jgi:hypothetical protein